MKPGESKTMLDENSYDRFATLQPMELRTQRDWWPVVELILSVSVLLLVAGAYSRPDLKTLATKADVDRLLDRMPVPGAITPQPVEAIAEANALGNRVAAAEREIQRLGCAMGATQADLRNHICRTGGVPVLPIQPGEHSVLVLPPPLEQRIATIEAALHARTPDSNALTELQARDRERGKRITDLEKEVADLKARCDKSHKSNNVGRGHATGCATSADGATAKTAWIVPATAIGAALPCKLVSASPAMNWGTPSPSTPPLALPSLAGGVSP